MGLSKTFDSPDDHEPEIAEVQEQNSNDEVEYLRTTVTRPMKQIKREVESDEDADGDADDGADGDAHDDGDGDAHDDGDEDEDGDDAPPPPNPPSSSSKNRLASMGMDVNFVLGNKDLLDDSDDELRTAEGKIKSRMVLPLFGKGNANQTSVSSSSSANSHNPSAPSNRASSSSSANKSSSAPSSSSARKATGASATTTAAKKKAAAAIKNKKN